VLLNEEALADDKADFDRYFEKVIDAQLIFSPTATEAAQIALARRDTVTELIRKYCVSLNISNIRVIKKIERLVLQIVPQLKSFSAELTQQAVHSLTLFGWSKFQPGLAPPLEFYNTSSVERYLQQREAKSELSEEDKKWRALLTEYKFMNMDEFDLE
jgi:hypothetical protein